MAKKRRTYSGFEKQRARELAGQIGVKAASKRLGIPESTLRSWGTVAPQRPAAARPASRPQEVRKVPAERPIPEKLPFPIYLQWSFIAVVFLLGCFGMLLTIGAAALLLVAIVLAVMRWQDKDQYSASAKKPNPVQASSEKPPALEPSAPTEESAPSVEEAPVAVETPIEAEETPASKMEAQAPTEEPAPAEKPVIKKYMSDYHYDDVKLCVIKGQEPDFDSLPIGTELFFWTEPKNKHDKKAIKVCTAGDKKVGYLYSGSLRDMTRDFVRRDDAVIGQVTYNDGESIKFCMDFVRDDDDDDIDF
ncbi:MAG: hypothetical protein LUD78_06130 [Clostridiales bacterium]|nr:hypothetical protein [Clostridiales bacterium]